MEFSVLVSKMLIFSVLMLLGYVFARKGLVDKSFGRTASMLVVNVFLPATILNSAFTGEMELGPGGLLKVLLLTTLSLGIGYLIGFVVARLHPVGRDPQRGPVFELLLSLSNNMFIGMPVAQVLFGPTAVFYCAVSCIPFNLYTYTYGVWRLKGSSGGKMRLKDIFSVPLVATLLAVLIFALRLPVPAVVKDLTGVLNGATMPMSLLVIGFTMGSVSLADGFKNKQHYLISLVRLIVNPVLCWLLVRLFTDDPVLRMTCMLLAASPCAVMATVLAIQYGRDGVYGAEGVMQSTLLSIVTIPALILILG